MNLENTPDSQQIPATTVSYSQRSLGGVGNTIPSQVTVTRPCTSHLLKVKLFSLWHQIKDNLLHIPWLNIEYFRFPNTLWLSVEPKGEGSKHKRQTSFTTLSKTISKTWRHLYNNHNILVFYDWPLHRYFTWLFILPLW